MERFRQTYEDALLQHGDTAQGALWPDDEGRRVRFDVMLDVIERRDDEPVILCDFGCGTGELLGHIQRCGLRNIEYVGVDTSERALSFARSKFPDAKFVNVDIADPSVDLSAIACDYLVFDGLFTGRFGIPHEEMWAFVASTIRRCWPYVRRGLAFNVMSAVVDWRRDDLFHASMDDVARLLHEIAGRNIRIRADYGLYEYTAFARRASWDGGDAAAHINVAHPKLPTTRDLLRYLPRIDRTRIYTNHGPLMLEFQSRMCRLLGLPPGAFVTAASGTAAIVGAILASAGRARKEKPLALLPGFTYVATAYAVEQCGFVPYLVDVDASTWMLDPRPLRGHAALKRAGVIVPVMPFGRAFSLEPWKAFRAETGVPVVIDAAAAFDVMAEAPAEYFGAIPVAMSFHATKSFSTGEGGGVVTTDRDLAYRTTQTLNLGIHETTAARTPGINGKMSEYHAAVGLAELDRWPEKSAALKRVAQSYRRESERAHIDDSIFVAPRIGLSYALFNARSISQSDAVRSALEQDGIAHRFWYGRGLHRHPYFADAAHDDLSVTEQIASQLLGLPSAPDLDETTIARIVSAVIRGI